jgi:hypothetical protein
VYKFGDDGKGWMQAHRRCCLNMGIAASVAGRCNLRL